ncbi:hypothetical protein [Metabacillus halosaccharovorans]|uniref:Uncharacterized protein n=1 Tax=Metabacillus halosaccharovorans TaxID=930124 RepID=A0ABT3DCD3_9BACI|nr:hypothetical protein [Metabacillus halosaccharovorans]MCV9884715.1 hypothetical protein [Metabacillus halosaccharovorans]
MQLTVKAHFNKQTKDSKKELIQFYVKGEDEKKPEISQLTREVVELEIEGVDQKLTCEFNKTTKDSKKTVLEFIVKGDTSAEQSFNFYKKAGSDVTLNIVESQMSIDEFYEESEQREGINYKVDKDGTVNVDQVTIDQVAAAAESEETEQEEKEVNEDELL